MPTTSLTRTLGDQAPPAGRIEKYKSGTATVSKVIPRGIGIAQIVDGQGRPKLVPGGHVVDPFLGAPSTARRPEHIEDVAGSKARIGENYEQGAVFEDDDMRSSVTLAVLVLSLSAGDHAPPGGREAK